MRPDAHDAYLRGRYLQFRFHNDKAGPYFQKATELQPDYALGWSGLSDFYAVGALIGQLNPKDSLWSAEAAARRAVSLDDSLAQAHMSLCGSIYVNRWDWATAGRECSRALELDPNSSDVYCVRAEMLAALSRHREAIEAQRKSEELEVFARPYALAYSLELARQYDAAISEARARLESDPTNILLLGVLSETYRRKGMDKEAVETTEKLLLATGNAAAAESVQRAFQHRGYETVLRWQLKALKQESFARYVSPVAMAGLCAQLKRREETLALLEQGFQEHSPLLLHIQSDPAYDFLHSDERYRSIIRRIALPPAY